MELISQSARCSMSRVASIARNPTWHLTDAETLAEPEHIARMSTRTISFPANQAAADIGVQASTRQADTNWLAHRPKLRTERSSIVQTMTRGRSHIVSVEIRRRRPVKVGATK